MFFLLVDCGHVVLCHAPHTILVIPPFLNKMTVHSAQRSFSSFGGVDVSHVVGVKRVLPSVA